MSVENVCGAECVHVCVGVATHMVDGSDKFNGSTLVAAMNFIMQGLASVLRKIEFRFFRDRRNSLRKKNAQTMHLQH